jgi:hypothetical protein
MSAAIDETITAPAGFGTQFTKHMAVQRWRRDAGWQSLEGSSISNVGLRGEMS